MCFGWKSPDYRFGNAIVNLRLEIRGSPRILTKVPSGFGFQLELLTFWYMCFYLRLSDSTQHFWLALGRAGRETVVETSEGRQCHLYFDLERFQPSPFPGDTCGSMTN